MALTRGVYCLLFTVPACRVRVGALGDLPFDQGWYVYVGSARGPGGFARVRRHIRVNREGTNRPRWHIDHLSRHSGVRLRAWICADTDLPVECDLARAIGGAAVEGFGCSDCRCGSHLRYRRFDPTEEVRAAFSGLGLFPRAQQSNSRITEQ